jgi:hypothetical protein
MKSRWACPNEVVTMSAKSSAGEGACSLTASNAIVTLRALTSVRRASRPKGKVDCAKIVALHSYHLQYISPSTYLLTTSCAIISALQLHPSPCRNAAGLFLTLLLHNRVNASLTYHVLLLLRARRTISTCPRICATPCRIVSRHHSSNSDADQQRRYPPNTAHRRPSRCRGETAA